MLYRPSKRILANRALPSLPYTLSPSCVPLNILVPSAADGTKNWHTFRSELSFWNIRPMFTARGMFTTPTRFSEPQSMNMLHALAVLGAVTFPTVSRREHPVNINPTSYIPSLEALAFSPISTDLTLISQLTFENIRPALLHRGVTTLFSEPA